MTDAATNRPLRIFLCHASNDKPAVRDLHRRLTADGFAPWLDEEDLLPGQRWQVEIPKAVRESDVVLVCLSQQSINKTGYVQKEIKFALDVADEQPDGTIFLIPLRLEECDVPERLNHLQWVNFYDEGGYTRLLRALRRRAADLNACVTSANIGPAPFTALETSSPSASNVSGGVKVEANNVIVGKDVVGRDKITQTTINIEHATIIHSDASVQEIKPASEASPSVANVLRSSDKVRLPGEIWLSDPNNRRVIRSLEFSRVPAGKFLMGSKDDNKMAQDNEHMQHTVEIPYDYWIGRYPVMNDQFDQFVASAKYKFDQSDWRKKANHPVANVSWHDAMAYCKWLNDMLHDELKDLTLRLPTEAEWEKAARGLQGNEWPWGNEFDQNKCNSDEGGKGSTTPVGAYSPQGDSPYGAGDMAGNVWEWCHSLYKRYPHQAADGRENETDSGTRVLRGGSFGSYQWGARAARRDDSLPDFRARSVGFRVVVSPGF